MSEPPIGPDSDVALLDPEQYQKHGNSCQMIKIVMISTMIITALGIGIGLTVKTTLPGKNTNRAGVHEFF